MDSKVCVFCQDNYCECSGSENNTYPCVGHCEDYITEEEFLDWAQTLDSDKAKDYGFIN